MKPTRYFSRVFRQLMLMSISTMILLGCKSSEQIPNQYEMVQTQAIAHTPYNVTRFFVNDYWGGSAGAYGTGGGGVCCVPIPPKWREGLTAKVRWTHSEAINDVRGNPIGETIWYESDAPILPYQKWNVVEVHFFPDGTAKIVVLSPENVANPPISDPVRPKGWKYPNPDEAYCNSVKLTKLTKQECFEKLKELDQALEGKIPLK